MAAQQSLLHRHGGRACETCSVRGRAICGALNDDQLEQLAEVSGTTNVRRGSTLIMEGDSARNFYVLVSGALTLYKLLPDGRRQITGFAFDGDFVGLAEDGLYPQSADALVDTELCRMPRDNFDDLCVKIPNLGRKTLEQARCDLAAAQNQLVLLGCKTAQEKVATFLLDLHHRAESRGNTSQLVDLPMSRSDIADYLGLTIETVSRTLTKLRKSNAVSIPNTSGIVIEDMDLLEEMSALD